MVFFRLDAFLPRNLDAMPESLLDGSWRRISTDDGPVMSAATNDGGSGGLACVKPKTSRFNVFARRFHANACFSVSPPAQPVIVDDGYAFPMMLENEARVFNGVLHGSSSKPPNSWSRISASFRKRFKWTPSWSGEETGKIRIGIKSRFSFRWSGNV